jgi:hypothetical protein
MLWATKITFHVKSFYATHAHVTHVQCFFSVFPPLSLLETHFSSFFLVFSCIEYLILPRVRGTYPLSHTYKKQRQEASACNLHILHPPFFSPLSLLETHFSSFFLVFSCIEYLMLPRIRGTFPLSHTGKNNFRKQAHATTTPFFYLFFHLFTSI